MWLITNFCLVICYFTSCYILTFNIQIYDGVWYHDNISYILNIYNTFRCRYLHLLLHFMLHPDIQCSDLWWCMIIMIYHMLLHFMLHPDIQYSDLWWCMIMIYHMLLHFMLHPDIWYSDLWWCMVIIKI